MVQRVGPEDLDLTIKFGGGLHTRAPEDEIGDREATDGQNFLIDVENSNLRPRAPFDLLGTAPNAAEIRGGGSFRLADGTVSAFVQAGTKVYEWDGSSFMASPVLATVNSGAKLRGHWRSHNWELDGKLLISDLALLEVVKSWTGSVWANIAFLSAPAVSFGAFYCKYISITNERVMYSNCRDAGGTFGHMMVGSKRSDFATISVSNRPSSALSEADPFFLLTPDLRTINGFVAAFGTSALSTNHGKIFNLTGESPQDFAFSEFYPNSAASGDESLAYIGSDVIYGRQGRVESVKDTDRFGETEADDLTTGIADQVRDYTGWRTVFNSRLNRVYLFPDGVSEVWVFDTAMRGSNQSPWMRWRTSHALAFTPTFVMSMLDPLDGLEYVFMGDSTGKFYRLEGTGSSGDGGTTPIQTSWVSKLFSLSLDARISNVVGYLKYRKGTSAAEIAIQLLYAGENVFDEEIIVSIPATVAGGYYNDGNYYSDAIYYGTANLNRLTRQRINIAGGDANEFQVRISCTSAGSFDLNELGLRFRGAS